MNNKQKKSLDDLIKTNPELKDALEKIGDVWEKGLREAFEIPDEWLYKAGYTSTESWERMVKLLGPENIKFISGHVKEPDENGVSAMRYSMFISPEGRAIAADQMKKLNSEIEEIEKEINRFEVETK
jgi:hypothetical protein